MSKSMRRFSEWAFGANEGAVTQVRLLRGIRARHKGKGAHPRVMSRRVGRSPGTVALTVRVPDEMGYLIYEVVTSNPGETAARVMAGAWL